MTASLDLRQTAREIFDVALRSVDAFEAVGRAVRIEGTRLTVCGTTHNLARHGGEIYVIAIGKAALRMAAALDDILSDKITAGLIVGHAAPQLSEGTNAFSSLKEFGPGWQCIQGGHPLPDKSSLVAAEAAFRLLEQANQKRALVIFLISGGGSAMLEWPRDERTTLADLREANRVLVSCGAAIDEINAVRRAFSAVKGGGLAARAPDSDQVSLIISDTRAGEESIVASGPTFDPPPEAPTASSIIARYSLAERLPPSILRAVKHQRESPRTTSSKRLRDHHVLLDNDVGLTAAGDEARRRGFVFEIARDISDQPIQNGCAEMLSRLRTLRESASDKIVCLVSGGEFGCPVRERGIGGRNAETALRCAIKIDAYASASNRETSRHIAVLSAGTDGIDGNSPAAGAVADETTIEQANQMNLDAMRFLDLSDAYTFFNQLGDTIVTGPTGTNVRDIRILLAC